MVRRGGSGHADGRNEFRKGRAMPNLMEKTFIGLHKGLYRISGGKIMGSFDKMPVMMLTTTGRKSGKSRTPPLMFIEEAAGYVVVGSAAGRDQHPAWFLNLQAQPDARVRIGKETTAVRARFTEGEERSRLFAAFTDTAKRYADYQGKTGREIPVAVLERQS
ncbi:MAG: protein of unknown function (DUF385) [Chloroflexi bacterium]|jgi:deazaflavin-dependent oxidoreductase (nitroreductase family)|nr:MAG: protein of unknown function (DUF385) [Chloroflexota bacterium]